YLQSDDGRAKVFLYDADDERIVTFSCPLDSCGLGTAQETWTLRGLAGDVLRVYSRPDGDEWAWSMDYVHGAIQLLGAVEAADTGGENKFYFHLDHLGTPRQITSGTRQEEALHSYYPLGQEATLPTKDAFQLKFTGHERDATGLAGDLDYMHARYHSPTIGRHLSVDPISGNPMAPQTWNRYAYVIGNPIKFIDPDGKRVVVPYRGDLERNARIRAKVQSNVESVPVIGPPTAWLLDFLLAEYLPANRKELQESVNSAAIGLANPIAAIVPKGRALRAADLGIKGVIRELSGSLSISEGTAIVRIDMLKAEVRNPLGIINNLIELARKKGASRLRIEGTLANEDLLRVLRKRYGMKTEGGTDYIEFVFDVVDHEQYL
ncbi:MAG: RHS repeat-associated core domain-containing protein, partial [bacterium]|nr:RHS repeat-associated core domain-containing protein [bacterium]